MKAHHACVLVAAAVLSLPLASPRGYSQTNVEVQTAAPADKSNAPLRDANGNVVKDSKGNVVLQRPGKVAVTDANGQIVRDSDGNVTWMDAPAAAPATSVVVVKESTTAERSDRPQWVGTFFGPRISYYDTKIGTNWAPGLVLRGQGATLGFELSGDYRNTTNTSWPLQASILGRLIPDSVVTPYIFGGGDYIPIRHRKGVWGAHAGAGLQGALNRSWTLDGSWRYHWLGNSTDASGVSFHDNGWQLALAILYHF